MTRHPADYFIVAVEVAAWGFAMSGLLNIMRASIGLLPYGSLAEWLFVIAGLLAIGNLALGFCWSARALYRLVRFGDVLGRLR